MLYAERKNFILQQLELTPIVKIPELSSFLQVSIDTIRRDLKNLEKEGLLECVRGGARIPDKALQFPDFKGREIIDIHQKMQAAKKAISLIHQHDVIMLNSGTTNTMLAQELVRTSLSCTIVTNNFAVVSVMLQNPAFKVIVAGGELDTTEQSLYGTQCETELNKYHPDLCFLSIHAVDPTSGFTDFRFHEIPIMQTMQKTAKRTLAVMDSGKLNQISKKAVFTHEPLPTIIMDDQITAETKSLYAENGIHIL